MSEPLAHNLFWARRLADDAVLIAGALVETGSVASLFEQPRDPHMTAFCQGHTVYR